MSHYIAILTTADYYPVNGDDGYETIVRSITDWEVVTDDEFNSLQAAQYQFGFKIIERPVDPPKFIAKTVSDYKKIVAEAEKQAAIEKKKREDAALARKMKKELKDKDSKERMLQKLVAELGPDAVQSALAVK